MSNFFERFISIEEVTQNFQKVEAVIVEHGEVIVVKDNVFQYVILPMTKYDEVHNELRELQSVKDKVDLKPLLNGIGKEVFINYYYNFKKDEDPFSFLPTHFSESSIRSRASKARAIFKRGLEIDALRVVIDSVRTNPEAIEKAKEIIKIELEI